ncbi:MAG: septum formation initiator family protein [Pyrinomonadaceae bacterium]|nr:septum formation initiator family protein [Pyrinomonadaceae bacterium]MCX7640385.1 septum formation initiator family protein [Pyrinomonadaceae bacterium]MDW8304813.1 septum formation initiator family protein [Acidobacteriota bacterium]
MLRAGYLPRTKIAANETIRFRYQTRKSRSVERKIMHSFWLTFCLIALYSFMFCLAANLRAHRELKEEAQKYEVLSKRAEALRQENQMLEEEINRLKSDPATIAREARKLGMSKPNEKVFVSVE